MRALWFQTQSLSPCLCSRVDVSDTLAGQKPEPKQIVFNPEKEAREEEDQEESEEEV